MSVRCLLTFDCRTPQSAGWRQENSNITFANRGWRDVGATVHAQNSATAVAGFWEVQRESQETIGHHDPDLSSLGQFPKV